MDVPMGAQYRLFANGLGRFAPVLVPGPAGRLAS